MLAERFVVGDVLGRGGFGIAYLGEDLKWGELCTIKELAPAGAERRPDGLVELPGDGPYRRRLRDRFLQEAERTAGLRAEGVLPPRAWFVQNGTAYVVTEHAEGAETLEQRLRRRGRLPWEEVLPIAVRLLRTLEGIHRAGLLHRDVKPSNILLVSEGKVWLIDFGAAMEWHADSENAHLLVFTPGYAPPEQLDRHGVRSPATDMYAVAATLYEVLTGTPPPPATDRLIGVQLRPLHQVRPDLDPSVTDAIEAALELDQKLRPQSASEFLARLERGMVTGALQGDWRDFDERAVRLAGFRYGRWECPGCGGVLERVKPLRRGRCPVCREGTIRPREIPTDVCPACRAGVLRRWPAPVPVCPVCRAGLMRRPHALLLGSGRRLQCQQCGFVLEHVAGDRWRARPDPKNPAIPSGERSADDWIRASGCSPKVDVCDSCGARLEWEQDERWRLAGTIQHGMEWDRLYREEWACVAAGLEPTAGNAACDRCEAEYFVDVERVTLLGGHRDPFGFVDRHQGRCFDWDQLTWVGVGKTSLVPGVLCSRCQTEFDFAGDELRLVRGEGRLAGAAAETMSMEDWHRVAQGLPRSAEEDLFQERFDEAIVSAYERGEIDLAARQGLLWDGPARWRWETPRGASGGCSRATVERDLIRLRRLPRALTISLAEGFLLEELEGDGLALEVKQCRLLLWPEPIVLAVRLGSGTRKVPLDVQSLGRRLRHLAGNQDIP